MAGDPPRPDPRVIAAYLDDVDLELDAAMRLVADPPDRFAAFHLAASRREARHDEPWRAKLGNLEPLSSFATAYRYPSTTGKRKPGPSHGEVLEWIERIRELSAEARAALMKSG
jgi:hypothetical protein